MKSKQRKKRIRKEKNKVKKTTLAEDMKKLGYKDKLYV